MTRKTRFIALLVAALLCVAPVAAQTSQTLVVFAASSLTDAFEALAGGFEAAHPGVDILFHFAGSSELAAQLDAGAPADVFASANSRQMQAAADAGRIGAEPITFARNRLVLIVPADNPAGVTGLRDLANDGVLLVLAAPAVPVRDYTDAMLERMAADPAYGADYVAAVMANLVSEEQNVRGVTSKVALGEADAGIVYASDVTPDIAADVAVLPIPDALNTLAAYPVAVTDNPSDPELAQAFVDYLLSEEAQATLAGWNFVPARIPSLPDTVTLPPDGSITVDGQVLNPLTLTVESLQADFPTHTVTVQSADGSPLTYTGALLWDVLQAAQPNIDPNVNGDAFSLYVVATASDGYQSVVSWAEMSPDYANNLILLAYARDDAPLESPYAPLVLVNPSYRDPDSYNYAVVNLSLRDAPPVSR